MDALNDTEIFVVTDKSITYVKGYTNIPKLTGVESVYTVAENTNADKNGADYWVARVIVIQVPAYETDYSSVSLIFNDQQKTDKESARTAMAKAATEIALAATGVNRYLPSLNDKFKGENAPEMTVIPTRESWRNRWESYGFYELRNESVTDEGTEADISFIGYNDDTVGFNEYNDHNIYAGVIDRNQTINRRGDYLDVIMDDNGVTDTLGNSLSYAEDVSRIKLTSDTRFYTIGSTNGRYFTANELFLSSQEQEVQAGDKLIWAVDSNGKAIYIVDLTFDRERNTREFPASYSSAAWLEEIYADIISEQRYLRENDGDDSSTGSVTVTYKYVLDGSDPVETIAPDKEIKINKGTLHQFAVSAQDFAAPAGYEKKGSGDASFLKITGASENCYKTVDGVSHPNYALADITDDVTVTLMFTKKTNLTVQTSTDVSSTFANVYAKTDTTPGAGDGTDIKDGSTTVNSAIGDTVTIKATPTTAPAAGMGAHYTYDVKVLNGSTDVSADVGLAKTEGTNKANVSATFTMPGYNVKVVLEFKPVEYNVSLFVDDDFSNNVKLYQAGTTTAITGKLPALTDYTFSIGYDAHYEKNSSLEVFYSKDNGATWTESANSSGALAESTGTWTLDSAEIVGDILIKVSNAEKTTGTLSFEGAKLNTLKEAVDKNTPANTMLDATLTGGKVQEDGADRNFWFTDEFSFFVPEGTVVSIKGGTGCKSINQSTVFAPNGDVLGVVWTLSQFTADATIEAVAP